MVLVGVHERGLSFYYREGYYAAEMPAGWISPVDFSGRDAVRTAIRRASAKLGFPLRGPYHLLLFAEFFQYVSEIKAHMRPSFEEVRGLVGERYRSFYGSEKREIVLGYTFGIDGMYATASSQKVVEDLGASFPGPAHIYSGTLSFVQSLQRAFGSRPKLMGFFIEMGTALGASFLQGEPYAVSRLPVLERINPAASLPQEVVADYVSQVDEEVQTLLPPGMGNLHLVVTGAWGEEVLKQLGFSAPYEYHPVPKVWDIASVQDLLYHKHRGPAQRSNLKSLLLPGLVGVALVGTLAYAGLLQGRASALRQQIAYNEELIRRGKSMEEELRRAEEASKRYREAEGYLSLTQGPEGVLRPVLEGYGKLDPRFRLKEASFGQGGEAALKVVFEGSPFPDAPRHLREAFASVGYERVEIQRFEYGGEEKGLATFEVALFPKRRGEVR